MECGPGRGGTGRLWEGAGRDRVMSSDREAHSAPASPVGGRNAKQSRKTGIQDTFSPSPI